MDPTERDKRIAKTRVGITSLETKVTKLAGRTLRFARLAGPLSAAVSRSGANALRIGATQVNLNGGTDIALSLQGGL